MNLLGGTGSGGARFTHGPTRCLLARAPRGRAVLPRPCRHLRCTQGPAAGLGGVLCRSPSEPTQGTGRAQVSPRPQKHREGLPLRIELASVTIRESPGTASPVLEMPGWGQGGGPQPGGGGAVFWRPGGSSQGRAAPRARVSPFTGKCLCWPRRNSPCLSWVL